MEYLNYPLLESIDPAEYQRTRPYPWIGIDGALTAEGYRQLLASLPPVSLFDKDFGYQRKHGQQSHDRYTLEWGPERDAELPKPWVEFIHECQGERYREFLCGLYDAPACTFRLHWHYTPRGCSVSPHCDAEWKLGSHIFYLNTALDWSLAWGGETIALGGKPGLDERSAPEFDDFPIQIASHPMGNSSLFFRREAESWHGVRPLGCPLGALRKVFIVEFRKASLVNRARTVFGF